MQWRIVYGILIQFGPIFGVSNWDTLKPCTPKFPNSHASRLMSSSLLPLATRLRSALRTRLRFPPETLTLTLPSTRSYYAQKSPRHKLSSVLWPLAHPSVSLVPEIDRWVNQGKPVHAAELQHVIRELRKRRRYRQALEVSEWMKDQSNVRFTSSDQAVQLDLIGHVCGLAAAESYFNNIQGKGKNEKVQGALLNCYVRERLVDKSLSHLQKMKDLGFATCPLAYNGIMCLYTNTGQHDKVPSVFSEMKNAGISPDNFSYRICINSYGARSDFDGMETVIEEMEHQPQIVVDWNTYTVVASIYAKSALVDKAVSALKKAEKKLDKKNGVCYNHLVSLYGQLGHKVEMQRIWELQRSNCGKFTNRDYTSMLEALVKLGELEEAETLLKEWESSGNSFDFRIPNALVLGYRQKGLLDKAEAMIDGFLKEGKCPPSNTWGIIAAGYVEKGEMGKAYELLLNALCVYVPNGGWEPKHIKIIKDILHYLRDEGDINNVETFVGLLKNAMPMDRDMYHTLIKANIRAGRRVEEIRRNMKADGIEENEETLEILSSISTTNSS